MGEDEFLSYHTWLIDPTYNNDMAGRPHMYDMNRHIKRKLNTGRQMSRTEINWIPLDVRGELYFTYSLDPLRVLKCDPRTGYCQFVFEQKGSDQHPFSYDIDHLRGGTPWQLYRYPYYISVGHSVTVEHSPDKKSHYNTHILVLCVQPWRLVYVSRRMFFNSDFMNSVPIVRNHTISQPFFYPSGIIMWSDDVVDVSGHLNDFSGHVIRIEGIEKLVDEVTRRDEPNVSSGNSSGPAVRTIQQYLMQDMKASWPEHYFSGDIKV